MNTWPAILVSGPSDAVLPPVRSLPLAPDFIPVASPRPSARPSGLEGIAEEVGWEASCPGGTPQEISRGQDRPSDRRPRMGSELFHAPAGHRRKFLVPNTRIPALVRLGLLLPDLLRCPSGAMISLRTNRGLRPLTRTGPRLISAGVPPGRMESVALRSRRREEADRQPSAPHPTANVRMRQGTAGVPPASSRGVSPRVGPGGETPPELAGEDASTTPLVTHPPPHVGGYGDFLLITYH